MMNSDLKSLGHEQRTREHKLREYERRLLALGELWRLADATL